MKRQRQLSDLSLMLNTAEESVGDYLNAGDTKKIVRCLRKVDSWPATIDRVFGSFHRADEVRDIALGFDRVIDSLLNFESARSNTWLVSIYRPDSL